MGVQDMDGKKMLMLICLYLSSTTECYMERRQTEAGSVIHSPSSFLRSIFIMQSTGFNLS